MGASTDTETTPDIAGYRLGQAVGIQGLASIMAAKHKKFLHADKKAVLLEQSANAQVLKIRLGATRTHLQYAVLAIEQFTNRIEMGLDTLPHWTAEDADQLSNNLKYHVVKVQTSLLSLSDDLREYDEISPSVSSGCKQALAMGHESLDDIGATVKAVRRSDALEAVKRLSRIRERVRLLDAVLTQIQ